MKQIFTLLVAAAVCLSAKNAQAQLSQNFDNGVSYTNNCWEIEGFSPTTESTEIINGTASFYTNPPTNNNGSGTRDVRTPFLAINATTFSVSFNYKLNSTLSGQAVRMIEVGLLDRDGLFTSLDMISMNTNTPSVTQTNVFDKTFTLASTGIQRLVLKFSGSKGDGNTRMIVDDLLVSANAYYGPSTTCNSAPIAVNNTYNTNSNTTPYFGISVLNNDSDPNGESLTAALTTPSPDGTVVMNPNGTFTFTPNAGFTGTFTSFTYTVTDNGYSRMSSTATVSIYFSLVTTLPVKLLQFSGAAAAKTLLSWSVAANETGLLFEVQCSSNGSTFQTIATIFTSEKTGDEEYRFADAALKQTTAYRLKIVNKDGTFFYSNVVSLKAMAAEATITLLQNPVQRTLRFTLPAGTTALNGLFIYNAAGIPVYSEKTGAQKSNNTISLPLQPNLPAGTYILQVMTSSGSKTIRFIKQ